MRRPAFFSIIVIGLVSSIFIASCATSAKKDNLNGYNPVWPPQPAKAKIKLVDVFSIPDDLNIGKGFWQWVSDVFLGSEVQAMVRPMSIVVLNQKQIFVADPGVHGVHMYDLLEDNYQLVKLSDNKDMLSPVAITVSGNNEILITDSKQAQVYRYQYGDEFATVLELEEGLVQPTGIGVDQKTKEIYVVDTKRHQVLVYDQAGSLVRFIGKRGTGNGEFNYPTMLWLNSKEQILVTDSLNFRIQIMSKNGRYISQFGKAGDATGYQSRPKGVMSDHNGNIYVVDSLFHNIQIFNASGDYLLSVGEQGQEPGKFWLPTGIFIDDKRKIYVADSHNQRVQVFELLEAGR